MYNAENVATHTSNIQSFLPPAPEVLLLPWHYLVTGRPLDGICHSQPIICMTDVYGPYIPEREDGYIDVSGNCRIAIERLFEKADLMM